MEPVKCFQVEESGQVYRNPVKDSDGNVIGVSEEPVYRSSETGEILGRLRDLPVGAMWFAPWLDEMFNPQLQHTVIVRTPGGDWVIDGEASNCTMPNPEIRKEGKIYFAPFQSDHHCWIIHGVIPNLTVDKAGVTCAAGAGSIQIGGWHGFLRDGYLVE